jgi:uncharacterized DUF497 family protein
MQINYDSAKREKTLQERGLDFEDTRQVFAGPTYEFEDTRRAYDERRVICYGALEGRLVVVGYVVRGNARHVFSMRKTNEREISRFQSLLGQ